MPEYGLRPEPRHPEEPDVRPTSPVPWELGEGNLPRLPDPGYAAHRARLSARQRW